MLSIVQWLQELGLPQYADAFQANDIDASLLPRLNDQVLNDIGIASAGHRLRMLGAIDAVSLKKQTLADNTVQQTLGPPQTATEAERRQLTVMFCDLVGSTALAE